MTPRKELTMNRSFIQTLWHWGAVRAITLGFSLVAALVACAPESGNTGGGATRVRDDILQEPEGGAGGTNRG